MRRKSSLASPVFAVLLCLSVYSQAQLWSGVLSSSRAVDWSSTNPGVVGGIPSGSWTQCGSTIPAYSGSAATINNAISACPANKYVQLGAGTFTLTSGINMLSNVALRGMGADQTFLVFTGFISCNGANPGICFLGDPIYYGSGYVQPGGSNAATWTSGYAQGTTSITLANVGSIGIHNGSYIYLDQANDAGVGPDFFVCGAASTCATEGGTFGRGIGGISRGQVQIVTVTSGCSSTCKGAGPFNLTISPGLYSPNWRSGQNPGAWFPAATVTNSGIENFSIDTSAIANPSYDLKAIQFDNAANCWVKGIRSIRNPGRRSHIELQNSAHITVQDSYFYGGGTGGSVQYGIESLISSDNLIQNNIFQATGPIMMGPAIGTVVAYNFTINQPSSPNTWNSAMIWEHDAGVEYTLVEGNIGPGLTADSYHGNSNFNTLFRNRLTGQDTGKNQNTTAVALWAYNRYHNIIGNVLGVSGYTSTYISNPGGNGTTATVYAFGDGNGIANDPLVATTTMLWGNYDTVNAANRFVSSEIPTRISPYANAAPSNNNNLPASFYLASKPNWWGSMAWPPIGPDVTGGNIGGTGGHAYLTPAATCFLNSMGAPSDGSGNVLTFNANTCYPSSSGGTSNQAPPPPTNLTGTVQ